MEKFLNKIARRSVGSSSASENSPLIQERAKQSTQPPSSNEQPTSTNPSSSRRTPIDINALQSNPADRKPISSYHPNDRDEVAKWMLSKGQGTTMATYDTLLLAFDQEARIDEAGSLWNMILHTHTRSISKRLLSRMISLYDHHHMPEKIIEVFADMEELGVKPDEDTVRRVARAFDKLGQEDKKKLVLQRYACKWKYIHFKGERVKVKRELCDE